MKYFPFFHISLIFKKHQVCICFSFIESNPNHFSLLSPSDPNENKDIMMEEKFFADNPDKGKFFQYPFLCVTIIPIQYCL